MGPSRSNHQGDEYPIVRAASASGTTPRPLAAATSRFEFGGQAEQPRGQRIAFARIDTELPSPRSRPRRPHLAQTPIAQIQAASDNGTWCHVLDTHLPGPAAALVPSRSAAAPTRRLPRRRVRRLWAASRLRLKEPAGHRKGGGIGSALVVDVGSGRGIRTPDLRVMSPTSYHCSIPRRVAPGPSNAWPAPAYRISRE